MGSGLLVQVVAAEAVAVANMAGVKAVVAKAETVKQVQVHFHMTTQATRRFRTRTIMAFATSLQLSCRVQATPSA